MKILGLPDGKNMNILTEEEIISRATECFKNFKPTSDEIERMQKWEINNAREQLEKCKTEPMPYKLFRLNELMGYNNIDGLGCELTEEQFDDRLGQMPPVPFKRDIYKGWIVNECVSGNIYEHLFRYDEKFYCVYMEVDNATRKKCDNY